METITEIRRLLMQAEAEHGAFEVNVLKGRYDAEWPGWYADWLIEHGIHKHLPSPLTGNELSMQLSTLNNEYHQSDRSSHWSQFYAERLASLIED